MEIKLNDWLNEIKKRGGIRHVKFKCPACGHTQSATDLSKQTKSNDPMNDVYVSCMGRFKKSDGTIFNDKSPCDYASFGFLTLNNVFVIKEDGENTPVFDFEENPLFVKAPKS